MQNQDPFADAPVISTYSVEQAIEDGVLFDANQLPGADEDPGKAEASRMVRERFRGNAVLYSSGLYLLIKETAAKRSYDWPGIVHDVLSLGRPAIMAAAREADEQGSGFESFQVLIDGKLTKLFATIDGNGLTLMLPEDY